MSTSNNHSQAPPCIDHFGDVSVVRYPDGQTLLVRADEFERLNSPLRPQSVPAPSERYWNWAAWAAVGISVALAGWELAHQHAPRWRSKISRWLQRMTLVQPWAKLTNLRRHLEFVYGFQRASTPAPAHSRAQSSPRRKS